MGVLFCVLKDTSLAPTIFEFTKELDSQSVETLLFYYVSVVF